MAAAPVPVALPPRDAHKEVKMADNDVFEIMSTTRSMRRLKPDPVPDDLIRKILNAGWAPRTAATRRTGALWC